MGHPIISWYRRYYHSMILISRDRASAAVGSSRRARATIQACTPHHSNLNCHDYSTGIFFFNGESRAESGPDEYRRAPSHGQSTRSRSEWSRSDAGPVPGQLRARATVTGTVLSTRPH
eukprot:763828-Hanusia_phi.AAC.2